MSRTEQVLNQMKARGLTQFLLTDPVSIDYLTGFRVEPGERLLALLLRTSGQHVLFLNRLFPVPALDIPAETFDDSDDAIQVLMKHINPEKLLGIDKNWPARFLLPLIDRKAAKAYRDASICIDMVRAVKDPIEQELMRRASRLNDEVMQQARDQLRSGLTELDLAAWIVSAYRGAGAEGPSFPPIVAFGDNAANPHHEPGDRALLPGDTVLLDIGCRLDGYCSDMTRTFFTRIPTAEAFEVYELVRRANLAAISLIRPGVRMYELDEAARNVITHGGYGEAFTHRLGHFIGREEHEFGDVSSENNWIAQPGMIFSIEPGIYLPGRIGVRIEDLVLVTEQGCEVLNRADKEIQVVSLE